jgi:phosphatidylserine/phosphatidylglycerophosphate/cardiolipin synthase-like enzyme
MRFKSRRNDAGQVFAVTGTNTVSFGIAASEATLDGLLGFAVERIDPATGARRFVDGFKVFESLVPQPTPDLRVTTREHPVQSLSWDDFTAAADHEYRYVFHPMKGTPASPDFPTPTMSVRVRTEPLTGEAHDIFFNRGVASSQAYVREFGIAPIDTLEPERRARALAWLSRDLDDAILRFVDACAPGDTLLGCFYEFRYRPVAEALRAAVDRGVAVRLVVDGKVNEHTDSDGDFHPSFPREDNLALLADVGLLPGNPGDVTLREARRSAIAHNKFMVRVAGGQGPTEVWTGSTNLSQGGISGQTNVGHWARDPAVADLFRRYWELIATDPGGRPGEPLNVVKQKNAALRDAVVALSPVPADLRDIPTGTTVAFSPRRGTTLLDAYAQLLDGAGGHGCLTLAFGINARFKALLQDNTAQNALIFLLLEKRDKPKPNDGSAFVRINSRQNVYQAWGSFLRNPVYQWARETNAGMLGLNKHVSYIHSKFMLIDPLGTDPIVITGSANFSDDSTDENDENMLLIRGNRRVADIYLTEFNRIFNHYYFRSVTESRFGQAPTADDSRFLAEDDSWRAKYKPGSLRAKRLALFSSMEGFTAL